VRHSRLKGGREGFSFHPSPAWPHISLHEVEASRPLVEIENFLHLAAHIGLDLPPRRTIWRTILGS
jgi:hypothetical protein